MKVNSPRRDEADTVRGAPKAAGPAPGSGDWRLRRPREKRGRFTPHRLPGGRGCRSPNNGFAGGRVPVAGGGFGKRRLKSPEARPLPLCGLALAVNRVLAWCWRRFAFSKSGLPGSAHNRGTNRRLNLLPLRAGHRQDSRILRSSPSGSSTIRQSLSNTIV